MGIRRAKSHIISSRRSWTTIRKTKTVIKRFKASKRMHLWWVKWATILWRTNRQTVAAVPVKKQRWFTGQIKTWRHRIGFWTNRLMHPPRLVWLAWAERTLNGNRLWRRGSRAGRVPSSFNDRPSSLTTVRQWMYKSRLKMNSWRFRDHSVL